MKSVFSFFILFFSISPIAQVPNWMPINPGKANLIELDSKVVLFNKALTVRVDYSQSPSIDRIVNEYTKEVLITSGPLFELILDDGQTISAGDFRITSVKSQHDSNSSKVILQLENVERKLSMLLEFVLSEDSNFIHGTIDLKSLQDSIHIRDIRLMQFSGTAPKILGSVGGSPIVDRHFFFGIEDPMFKSIVERKNFRCEIERKIPLLRGLSIKYGFVIGVTPSNQIRRGFNYYLEKCRPRKYEPFLHYNSWYDLAFGGQFVANDCVKRINEIGSELVTKRKVKLESYLFDDGWDDTSKLWQFHSGFPNGFTPLKTAAAKYGASAGVWLSPWGGYGKSRVERLQTGKSNDFEIDEQGFALSGKKYYELFLKTCLNFVNAFGVNHFKFDGTGSPNKQFPGSNFGSDFDAAIDLISHLRKAQNDLFVNLTTGTWPSPFWLLIADSIWRGGSDHAFAGVGSWRQKWITYRDGQTFNGIVKKGPLFPLNSLMVHGIIFAEHANHLNDDPENDLLSELVTYFASGTQLQELYVTPNLLSSSNWDDIAKLAIWSKDNQSILIDSHWVGGDPMKLEVYGWASWKDQNSIVTLRNPSDKPQSYSVDIADILELPSDAKGKWKATSSLGKPIKVECVIGKSKVVDLGPFEVIVLEGEFEN